MTMTLPVAEMRITKELQEAEAALDEALLRQSSLLAALIVSRRETGSAPFLGHEALLRIAKVQQSLLAAGSDLARVHGGLSKIGGEVLGILPCPPNEPMGYIGDNEALAA